MKLSVLPYLLAVLLMVTVVPAQTDSTLIDISEKKAELNDKNVEVLELQSDLSIHDQELQVIRDEIEKLKAYNQRLEDSLMAKQTQIDSLKEQQSEVENFKMIVNAFEEDQALTDEILASIEETEVVPEDTLETIPETEDVDDAAYRTDYNEALNLYFDRDYTASISAFEELLRRSQRHALADNCQYWLGENYYSQEKYMRAIEAFRKVEPLGDRNKADAALFKIGMSYLKMDQQAIAVETFKRLEREFPDSDLLEKARQYLTSQEKF